MAEPLPKRLSYVEPFRRRMRVRFGGIWIADSEKVLVLFEPGRYPLAYFPETDVSPNTLERSEHTTRHRDLGLTCWYTVRAGDNTAPRGAWQHIELSNYAGELQAADSVQFDGAQLHLEPGQTVFPTALIANSTSARRSVHKTAGHESGATWLDYFP